MPEPLLQTKLNPPPLPAQPVRRPRLHRRLSESLSGRLTLVSAPAGFGKTTLIVEWLTSQPQLLAAWLSLDEGDNDPTRFLRYCLAAVQNVDPSFGPLSHLPRQNLQDPPPEQIIINLINDLSTLKNRLLLVLDDYHLLDNPALHHALSYFIDHAPPNLHLIITSRTDPPLPLPRWRVRRHLHEIRAEDLRFTLEEATTFLNSLSQQKLSPSDIHALEARTEGWVAGLQLAALSLQGSANPQNFIAAFTGSHRYVIDYLLDEVLAQQLPAVQEFLQETALLNRFCAELCDAVLDSSTWAKHPNHAETRQLLLGPASPAPLSSRHFLNHLESTNLFLIPLDSNRRWYRYHQLFADALQAQLRHHRPERLAAVYLKASHWFEENGHISEATDYALKAQAFNRAANLVEQRVEAILSTLLTRYEVPTLLNWLTALPPSIIQHRPYLLIAHAWALLITQQSQSHINQAEAHLLQAEAHLHQQTASAPTPPDLAGHIAAIKSFVALARGQTAKTIALAEQALQYLPDTASFVRGGLHLLIANAHLSHWHWAEAQAAFQQALAYGQQTEQAFLQLESQSGLALIALEHGHLTHAESIYLSLLRTSANEQVRPLPAANRVYLLLNLAEIYRQWGAWHRAESWLTQARPLTEHHPSAKVLWCIIQSRVWLGQNRLAKAAAVLQTAPQSGQPPIEAGLATWLKAVQARLHLRMGQVSAAVAWQAQQNFSPADGQALQVRWGEYTTFVRVDLALGHFDSVINWLDTLTHLLDESHQPLRASEIYLLQALAHQAQGQPEAALQALRHALVLAEGQNYVALFLDEGPSLRPLLSPIAAQSAEFTFAQHVLDMFAQQAPPAEPESPPPSLVEPLSERELEVLALMAQGYTHQAIADDLIIALGTVKKHAHNIYGKLGVSNRTQAILKAKALGLVV